MNKYVLNIDGMMCGMCEAHINDVIRKSIPEAKKVNSSYKKNESSFIVEGSIDIDKLKEDIRNIGYEIKDYTVEEYKKKWSLF